MPQIKAPSNITELRNDLLEVYAELRSKKIDAASAKEAANVAGKVIGSLKTQLTYSELREETPQIDFIQ